MNPRTVAERIASVIVLAFLALFVVLSLDSLVRLWLARRGMDSQFEAATVMAYQFAHAAITLMGTFLAARVLYRAVQPGGRAFGWLLAFLTLWYTKAFGFGSFPGPFQSWLAERLFAVGMTREIAILLFASPAWAAWLALGAALRVSVSYPRAITVADIAAPGARDRQGLMRSIAFAGLDVGSIWRRLAGAAVERGWMNGALVWPLSFALGIAASLLPGLGIVFMALYAFAVAVVITNLRAGLAISNGLQRRRLLWMMQAGITALLAFGLAAVLSFTEDRAAAFLSFAIGAIAPLAVLTGVAIGSKPGHPPQPRNALRNTASRGAIVLVCALAYVSAQGLASTTGRPRVLASAFGLAAAVLTGLIAWRHVRSSVGRMIAPAFNRPQRSRA